MVAKDMRLRQQGRMLRLILALLAVSAAAVGFLYVRQPAALLNGIDALWRGPGGELVADGVAYGSLPRQRLDIWRPVGAGNDDHRPVIIFIHGGSWDSGARGQYGFAGRALASQGFVTAVIDYRLGAEGRFPAMVQDSAGATAWVLGNIARYGGDPQRVVIAGHSAGAYNAAMVALDPQWLRAAGSDPARLRGVAALAGPFDFYPFDGPKTRAAFGHVANAERETQPIAFARGDAPPLWLATGLDDVSVRPRNSARLAAAVQALGGQAEVKTYAGIDHGDIVMALSRPWRAKAPVLADMAAFAHRVTGIAPE